MPHRVDSFRHFDITVERLACITTDSDLTTVALTIVAIKEPGHSRNTWAAFSTA
jgi:hypothetical protein